MPDSNPIGPRIGSLFSGYGGLDLGVQSVLGGEVAWHVEFDKSPTKVLTHHWPQVPNLGDVTTINWDEVPPVDVLTGGYPCQPFSHAGKRKGTQARGKARRMTDTCGLTSCEPFAKWDHDSQSWRTSEATSLWDLTLSSLTLPQWGGLHDGELCEHPTPELATNAPDCSSLPTPTRADYRSVNPNPGVRNQGSGVMPASEHSLPAKVAALLPTPAVNDMGEGKTLEWWDDWAPRQKSSDGRPAPHGRSLAIEAQRLLPTPSAADGLGGHATRSGDRSSELLLPGLVKTFLPTPKATNNENRQSLDRYGMNLGMALQSIGETTDLPLPDGQQSWDDQPQHQLSLDGLGLPA